MATKPAALDKLTGLASRFGAFVAERYPFALGDVIDAFEAIARGRDPQRRGRHRRASSRAAARAHPAPEVTRRAAGSPGHHPRHVRTDPSRAGVSRASGRMRRLPAPVGDRRVADAGRAPRDPARHAADARDRQPPESVLHERRDPLRPHAVSGQGLPIAGAGSHLRGGRSACAVARPTAAPAGGPGTSSGR